MKIKEYVKYAMEQNNAKLKAYIQNLISNIHATVNITSTATVDNTSGTPNVTVTNTGTEESPNFAFSFTGLKGQKGDKGDPGNPGANGTTYENPTGTIIAFMGTTAPSGYLICNGTTYNISSYPALANHFQSQFGKKNYFGGNGSSTFAVPDLRGEFLRGTGTASRNTGSGAGVGVHQNPTQFPYIGNDPTNQNLWIPSQQNCAASGQSAANYHVDSDKWLVSSNKTGTYFHRSGTYSGSGEYAIYARPTNTAVLYCIKT